MRLFQAAKRGFSGRNVVFPNGGGGWLYGLNTSIDYKTDLGSPMDNSIVAILLGWYVKNWRQAKPVVMRKVRGKDDRPEYEHRIIDLLNNPNPFYGPSLFMEALIQDVKLDGTGLAQIVTDRDGIPSELYWLPTESMVPIYQSDGTEWINHWECTVGGKTRKLAPEEVLVWQEGKDPRYGGRKGYARFKAGIAEAYSDNAARDTVNAFFRNRAEMGTIISPSDRYMAELAKAGGDMGDACLNPMQAQALEAKINAKNKGDGKFSLNVFSVPMAITQLQSALKDIDLTAVRMTPESRLAALFHIHPVVAGLAVGLDASSDKHNMEAAQEMSWKNGIIPDQDEWAAVINRHLMPVMDSRPETCYFDFDRNQVEALQEDADARSTRVLAQWQQNAIKHGEMRTSLGMEIDEELKELYFKDIQAAQAEQAAELAASVAPDPNAKELLARKWRERSGT